MTPFSIRREIDMKRYQALFLVAVILTLAAFGCSPDKTGEEAGSDSPTEVAVMTAAGVSRPVVQTYPGRLAAYRKAEVRARAAGILLERNYEEGSQVKAGDLLFSIEDEQLKIDVQAAKGALARAEAEHQGAQDTLRRHSSLLTRQSINEHDHVASMTAEKRTRAEVESAAAALAQAELSLSYARVTAPISGRAGQELVSEGTLVGQDGLTPLTVIEQIDPIYVNFSQPANDYGAIKMAGAKGLVKEYDQSETVVQLLLPNGEIFEHQGRLVFADSSVNPDTDNISMKGLFPNPKGLLLPGAYLRVNLIQAVNPKVFLIPRDSLVREENSSHLFVISPEGLAERRTVTADKMEGKNWLITAGLSDGDKVILDSGQAASLEGKKVMAAPAPAAAQASE